MNINIIPPKEYSRKSILQQTKCFCCQQPIKISCNSYFVYEDILFSVLKKEVQISTLCDTTNKYSIICDYIDCVFANKRIGLFGNCNRKLFEKIETAEVLWV